MILVLMASTSFPAWSQSSLDELLEKAYQYCVVREQTTELMAHGRDSGILRESVEAKLQPPTSTTPDMATATISRLEDVYRYTRLSGRTLFHFRVSRCIQRAMHGAEPVFGPDIEDLLLGCQRRPSSDETLSTCVAGIAVGSRQK